MNSPRSFCTVLRPTSSVPTPVPRYLGKCYLRNGVTIPDAVAKGLGIPTFDVNALLLLLEAIVAEPGAIEDLGAAWVANFVFHFYQSLKMHTISRSVALFVDGDAIM